MKSWFLILIDFPIPLVIQGSDKLNILEWSNRENTSEHTYFPNAAVWAVILSVPLLPGARSLRPSTDLTCTPDLTSQKVIWLSSDATATWLPSGLTLNANTVQHKHLFNSNILLTGKWKVSLALDRNYKSYRYQSTVLAKGNLTVSRELRKWVYPNEPKFRHLLQPV